MPINPSKWLVKTCPSCSKQFPAPMWRLTRVAKIYCSAKCAKHTVELRCDNCGRSINKPPSAIKTHNFCCRKCARSGQTKNNLGRKRIRVELTCPVCNSTFERQPNQIKHSKVQYCSKSCFYSAHKIYMGGERNPSWRGGMEPYYGNNWETQSRKARDRDSHTCQRCRISESQLHCKLHVHHIISLRTFARDFRRANSLSNLVSLCPSCHKFLEWHRDQMNQFLASWHSKTSPVPQQ